MGSSIVRVEARQILDSRGRPTVEVDIGLANGVVARASSPSGASTGRHEAHELRDDDVEDYGGLSVGRAVHNVRTSIADALIGADPRDQAMLDQRMRQLDPTPNLVTIGANAVLAASLAISRAAANEEGLPLHRYIAGLGEFGEPSLPMPMTNILSGGAHAGRGMDIQDFLVVPCSATSYTQALAMIAQVRSAASDIMTERGLSILLADEGGLSPGFAKAEAALALMSEAIERSGFTLGVDAAIALDIAASELRQGDRYELEREGRSLGREEMTAFLGEIVAHHPVISIEDGLDQDDWSGWKDLTRKLQHLQIVGDDLFATNKERVQRGIDEGVANAVLVKLNQNGTLTGTLDVIRTARRAGYAAVVSARSGETEDSFIADLAVATGSGQIKIGSVRGGERLSKYNQLLRIESEAELEFAGMRGFGGASRDKKATATFAQPASRISA